MFPRNNVFISKRESHLMSYITNGLYLSGLGGVTREGSLESLNITHVLNVAVELMSLKYKCGDRSVNVRYVHLQDNSQENILPYLNELIHYIHDIISKGDNIVVHCVGGVSRSATICIAFMIKFHDMTLREAYHHVLKQRSIIHPNNSFWRSLICFEENVRQSTSVELLPYITGMVADVYKNETERRILIGWMDHVFYNWCLHLVILILQIIFA
ncbi:hypothetical protein SNE40_019677 [Patella caerulea]|uniref:Dual specificity protein phosphatase 14 n=1 Tax=Patella caerulea TaxID=87958 RepID=A0AAN8J7G5_PATCE